MKKILMFVIMVVLCMVLTACGEREGTNVSSKNTIDWPADFYGEVIPAPDGYTKAAEISEETSLSGDIVTTVRIDGITYAEYKAYCEKLEGLDGWVSKDTNDELPETTTEKRVFDFRGEFNSLPKVTATYYGAEDSKVKSGDRYVFAMFIYKVLN